METQSHLARRSRILVADAAQGTQALFARLLSGDGHDVMAATDGLAALDAVRRYNPDVVVLGAHMAELDAFEVCRRLKSDPATRLTPVVLVAAIRGLAERLKGIEVGADDVLSEPVHPYELRARVGSLARQKLVTDSLDSAETAFMALVLTLEARDPHMNGHSERLSSYAVAIGRALGLSGEDLGALHRGGYLHDIGKVGIPDSILLKPGPLTVSEFTLMKRHAEIGDHLCAPLQSLRHVRPIVLCHHERIDGSGYPQGLIGDDVPLLAQIVSVVDVYDALTSERPYRTAAPRAVAVSHLLEEVALGRFAQHIVEAFLDVTGQTPSSLTH